MKTATTNIFKYIAILALICGSLLSYSYIVSKSSVLKLVGESVQYFPLKQSKITTLPVSGVRPGWYFRFLHIQCSEDFEIFTDLQGKIFATFPRKDIAETLRKYEQQEVHPYSLEGLKQIYPPVDKD